MPLLNVQTSGTVSIHKHVPVKHKTHSTGNTRCTVEHNVSSFVTIYSTPDRDVNVYSGGDAGVHFNETQGTVSRQLVRIVSSFAPGEPAIVLQQLRGYCLRWCELLLTWLNVRREIIRPALHEFVAGRAVVSFLAIETFYFQVQDPLKVVNLVARFVDIFTMNGSGMANCEVLFSSTI